MALTIIEAGSIADSSIINANFDDLQNQIIEQANIIAGLKQSIKELQKCFIVEDN